MVRAESAVETAKRRVREGEDRVVRQRELVADLIANGHPVERSKRLLRGLEELLALYHGRLAYLETWEANQTRGHPEYKNPLTR